MDYLVFGLALWGIVHLVPSVVPNSRHFCVQRLGENLYKGLFSLLIVASLVLIVTGWKSTPVELFYQPPTWGKQACFILMGLAIPLFISGRKPNVIRCFVRHPQLFSILVISAAHLLANGDNRSVILFSSLASWSVLEMFFISRREGPWNQPSSFPIKANIMVVIISAVVYSVLLFVHQYLSGVALI